MRGEGAVYNEHDPIAAAWLRKLIDAGAIAPGDVDTRNILDVLPSEYAGYAQVHLFAGIGVWSAALRAAGWPDDRPVWTGSCPCQPFSAAGKRGGFDDERHLWPAFDWLIGECRPDVILGEQVEGPAARLWVDLVSTDLEGKGYAFGSHVFPAAGVGSPQGRHRTYWVADDDARREGWRGMPERAAQRAVGPSGLAGELAYATRSGRAARIGYARAARHKLHNEGGGQTSVLAGADSRQCDRIPSGEGRQPDRREAGRFEGDGGAASDCAIVELADAYGRPASPKGLQRSRKHRQQQKDGRACLLAYHSRDGRREERADAGGLVVRDRAEGLAAGSGSSSSNLRPGPVNGFWRDADWIFCRDDKWRPIEPESFPLAHGAPARVGRLRGYGNAIVKQQAQAFIEAYMSLNRCL